MTTHKSRFGFHPCDYQTYTKLKRLNVALDRARRLVAAWRRWDRKDPHNRISREKLRNSRCQVVGYRAPQPLPEPPLCPVFTEKYQETTRWPKNGYVDTPVTLDRVRLLHSEVGEDYANARRPAASAEAVCPLSFTAEEIERLLGLLK